MNLTQQERDKFALWLVDEEKALNQVAERMRKLNLPGLSTNFIIEAAACQILANKLKSTESSQFGPFTVTRL